MGNDERRDTFVGSLGNDATGEELVFGGVGSSGNDAPSVSGAEAGEGVQLPWGGRINV